MCNCVFCYERKSTFSYIFSIKEKKYLYAWKNVEKKFWLLFFRGGGCFYICYQLRMLKGRPWVRIATSSLQKTVICTKSQSVYSKNNRKPQNSLLIFLAVHLCFLCGFTLRQLSLEQVHTRKWRHSPHVEIAYIATYT